MLLSAKPWRRDEGGQHEGALGRLSMGTRRAAERCRCVNSKRFPSAGLVWLSGLLWLWGPEDVRERRVALNLAAALLLQLSH